MRIFSFLFLLVFALGCNQSTQIEELNSSGEVGVEQDVNLRSTLDTTINLKFHLGEFSDPDTVVFVPVELTRDNRILKAKDNEKIKVTYVTYESQDSVLAIGLDESFYPGISPGTSGKKQWIWGDIYDSNGNYVETCQFYCNVDDDGIISDCCQENLGNCTGYGPFCSILV